MVAEQATQQSSGERVPLTILDLAPRAEWLNAAQTLEASLELAKMADRLGYHRYWMAEHHGSPCFQTSATALLLARAAENTVGIRIGAGGIMLPNHAPLVVAEQFGTLETLYPGRIDLGLGRAPGTDNITAQALRRTHGDLRDYMHDVVEVIDYLDDPDENDGVLSVSGAEAGVLGVPYRPVQNKAVRALPGEGTNVPIWILGSSSASARVAAALGLPLSVATHFALDQVKPAIELYRQNFNAESPVAQSPHSYLSGVVIMVVAPTREEAEYLATSGKLLNLNIKNGVVGGMPAPVADLRAHVGEEDWKFIQQRNGLFVNGTPAQVAQELQDIVEEYGFDELVLVCHVADPELRRRSYELLAAEWGLQPRR